MSEFGTCSNVLKDVLAHLSFLLDYRPQKQRPHCVRELSLHDLVLSYVIPFTTASPLATLASFLVLSVSLCSPCFLCPGHSSPSALTPSLPSTLFQRPFPS